MIYVVTGQPRHGKSQYVIKMIQGFIADNAKRVKDGKAPRKIYCDIAGINDADTPIKMPEVENQHLIFTDKPLWFGEHDDKAKPDGYVCPEPASVFIYDECHKVDWIKDTAGTLSKNPTTISMNEHGHEDFIFVLITQFPQFIHTHLRGLVEYHYHVKRFAGLKVATVYKWNEFKTSPRSKTAIDEIFEKDTFKFSKKYQNCYKSASSHESMKFSMPKEWIMMLAVIAVIGGFFFYTYSKSPVRAMISGKEGATFSGIRDSNGKPLAPATGSTGDTAAAAAPAAPAPAPLVDEIDELKRKYLPPHIYELKKDESITPAVAVGNANYCIVTNRLGERLNVDDDLCRLMLADATMMPKAKNRTASPAATGGTADTGGNDSSMGGSVEIKQIEPI